MFQPKSLDWLNGYIKKTWGWGVDLRWQRNRMGRPHSPQIHQMII